MTDSPESPGPVTFERCIRCELPVNSDVVTEPICDSSYKCVEAQRDHLKAQLSAQKAIGSTVTKLATALQAKVTAANALAEHLRIQLDERRAMFDAERAKREQAQSVGAALALEVTKIDSGLIHTIDWPVVRMLARKALAHLETSPAPPPEGPASPVAEGGKCPNEAAHQHILLGNACQACGARKLIGSVLRSRPTPTVERQAQAEGTSLHHGNTVSFVEWCKNCGHMGEPGESIKAEGAKASPAVTLLRSWSDDYRSKAGEPVDSIASKYYLSMRLANVLSDAANAVEKLGGAEGEEHEWEPLAKQRGIQLARLRHELHQTIDSKAAGWALAASRLEALNRLETERAALVELLNKRAIDNNEILSDDFIGKAEAIITDAPKDRDLNTWELTVAIAHMIDWAKQHERKPVL